MIHSQLFPEADAGERDVFGWGQRHGAREAHALLDIVAASEKPVLKALPARLVLQTDNMVFGDQLFSSFGGEV